jgi:hypothetical protein
MRPLTHEGAGPGAAFATSRAFTPPQHSSAATTRPGRSHRRLARSERPHRPVVVATAGQEDARPIHILSAGRPRPGKLMPAPMRSVAPASQRLGHPRQRDGQAHAARDERQFRRMTYVSAMPTTNTSDGLVMNGMLK